MLGGYYRDEYAAMVKKEGEKNLFVAGRRSKNRDHFSGKTSLAAGKTRGPRMAAQKRRRKK